MGHKLHFHTRFAVSPKKTNLNSTLTNYAAQDENSIAYLPLPQLKGEMV
ncbi:hypothetical protein Pcinc_044320, partial [Petrolisthes cinctipes]